MTGKRKKLDVKLINTMEKKFKMSENMDAKDTQCFGSKRKDGGYNCQICYVGYSGKSALRRHLANYEDPKYPCDECGTKFSNVQFLQSHISFTHGAEKFKNYRMKCPVCYQNIHMESTLRSHLCHVHDEWVERNFKKYKAEYCADETSANQNRQTAYWRRYMMIKFIKHIMSTTSNNDDETASEKSRPSKNSKKERLSEASKVYRDAESLRIRYSCKDCYVPLPRIDFGKRTPIKVVTPVKQRNTSPQKKSPYRGDQSKRREEIRPSNQLQNKRLRYDEGHPKESGSGDIEGHLDKLPATGVFIKTECDYENFEISMPVTEVLEECVDPLACGEAPTETTNNFAQYPTSFEFPVNIGILEVRTENPGQCTETSIGPVKVESMDCDDSPKRIEATDNAYPELRGTPGQPETVEYYYGGPSVEFTDASIEGMDTFEPVKLEIEEHPISEYSECRSEDAAERAEISEANSPMVETSSSATPASPTTQVQESCTMVASQICNKLFTSRRTMLRHFRKRHLSCFDDTVYCVCGKEMNGRRAMEKHFSRHCDRLVKTTRGTSEMKVCKPLEKKYKCTKCGQRFWLPTCLEDHPPNCELPKPKPVNPCRLIKNINRAYGLTSHFSEVGEYICRICDVKFTSIDTLLRHLRSFSTNEKATCPYCATVFTGPRLLKGHIQSTHETNSTTTYTYFCEICNQGFTKKINQRIHTMHIHPKEMMKKVIEGPSNYPPATDSVVPVVGATTPENQCNVCNLVFVNRKRFMDHVSYYNRGDHYRCNICGEEFDGQYKAHHHRKKVHYGRKIKTTYTHYCDLCQEGFMYKTHLHAHMFHVHDNQFNCVTSVKDYNLPEENGRSAEDVFPCKKCAKKFRTVSLLLVHMEAHHAEDPTKISKVKCSQCDRQFSTLVDCINHLKHSHSSVPLSHITNPPDVQPTHNSSTSPDVIDIDISVSDENVDSSGDQNARTTQPGATDEANGQKAANDKEDNTPSPPSVCLTCGFDCPGPWGLARHRALYLNSGIYACEFCGRRFSWQTYYRDHKLKHFRRDVHNNYFCPVCDEGFDTANDLQMHAIHLHEEPLDPLKCGPVPTTSRANIFRDDVTDANTTGDPHEPLTDTLGNDCELRYSQDCPDISNRSPTCNICNMVFISQEMLKIHRENSHPVVKEKELTLVPGSRSWVSMAIERKPKANANDRFYVLLGEKVHAQTVDSIGKRISICNKNIGLTSKLYRYDTPLTCDVCNLTFQSKDMLFSHREFLHKIIENFVFKPTSGNEKQSSQAKEVKNPEKSQEHGGKTDRVKGRSAASPPAVQSRSKRLPAVEQFSAEIDGNTDAEYIPSTGPAAKVQKIYYYKCGFCDIIFNEKNLMKIHEEKVHGLISGDDDAVNDVTLRPLNSVTEVSQPVCVDNLWIGSKTEFHPTMPPLTPCGKSGSTVKPVTRPISPEEIVISDEETLDSTEPIPRAPSPPFSRDKGSTSPPPLRLINLPPGNYKISKLKVRSTDTGKVTKLIRSTK